MNTKITTIEELNLSPRYHAFLRRRGICSLEQLLNTTEEELLSGGCYRNLGDLKSAEAVIQRLKELDIVLANKVHKESEYIDHKILDMFVTDLELETIICDILFENNIKKVSDIVSYTETEIFTMLGKEYFDAINKKLDILGVKFSKPEDNIKESARRNTEMDILDDDFYFDEDMEEGSIDDELKQHIDEICKEERQYICSIDCEFYKLCYANLNRCIKQIFAEVLDTLTPRESIVLKLKYGLYDRAYNLGEIAGYYSVTQERIRQIEAKALRKLRHPARREKIKKYIHDASSIEESSYFRLFTGIYGGIDKKTINESRLGFDFLIIDPDSSSHNILSVVLKELEQDVSEFTELSSYIDNLKLMNITTLNHLLHMEQYQLLSTAFKNDDVKFFDFKRTITVMGYRFKDEFYGASICDLIKYEFYKIFCDEHLLEEKITDIQIGTILKLLELDITTYGDLLKKIGLVINSKNFSEKEIEDINYTLHIKGLLFCRHDKTYLTSENIDGFLTNLINQMVSDRESIFLLIKDLTKEGKKFSDAISYIQSKYPTLKISVSPICTDVIEVLGLSVVTYNALNRVGISTIGQLISLTDIEMKKINDLSEKSIDELEEVLLKLGLNFNNAVPNGNMSTKEIDESEFPG